jgi:hypothetical protein
MSPSAQTDRRERWRSFMRRSQPGFLFLVVYEDPAFPTPKPPHFWPSCKQERIDNAIRSYDIQLRRAQVIDDDALPFLSNITGTEIFAEAFGCRVQRDDDKMPFALPRVHSAAEAGRLRAPDLGSSSLAYLFEIADRLAQHGGVGAPMKLVDIQSPMDITSLIWEKVSLFTALFETPEAVKELSAKVCDLLIAFMSAWFSRYGTDFISHYPSYFMEGGITLSEDEIGTVSPQMFDTFFKDELLRLSRTFGGLGIHCCANSRHQWGKLKALQGLRVLNINANDTTGQGFTIEESLAYFGNTFVQYPIGMKHASDPVGWIQANAPGRRLVVEVPAANRSEAQRLCGELNELRDRLFAGS